MNKIMCFLENSSRKVDRLCLIAAMTGLIVMLILVVFQVVARYVFFSAPYWTEEAARYCMVWSGLLGATVAYYRGADPAIKLFSFKSPKITKIVVLIQDIAVASFIIPILYFSPGFISRNYLRHSDALEINSGYVGIIIPLFAAVILFHLVIRVLLLFFKPKKSEY